VQSSLLHRLYIALFPYRLYCLLLLYYGSSKIWLNTLPLEVFTIKIKVPIEAIMKIAIN
jgi:hypothetical protein